MKKQVVLILLCSMICVGSMYPQAAQKNQSSRPVSFCELVKDMKNIQWKHGNWYSLGLPSVVFILWLDQK